MKTNIRDGATFDLFMRELKAQTSHLGGLMRTADLFFEEKYWILGDFSCYSMFTRRDILEFLENKIFLLGNLEDMKTLVSQFIDEIIAREYRYVRDESDLKIYKKIYKEGTSEPGVIEKKILSGSYIVKFYFTTRITGDERPVTMKLLRKIKMSKDEFLETFESKAKWDFSDVQIKYIHSDKYVFLEGPAFRNIGLDVINRRVLNRISEMLGSGSFLILSSNNRKAVAIEQKEALNHLKHFERREKSSLGFLLSVFNLIFYERGRVSPKNILHYNSKTKVLSTICDKDGC